MAEEEVVTYPKHHIIDPDNEETVFSADALGSWFEGADILQQGNDFGVVSVLGCQSSGKSTLLNILFNTNFDVMEESDGRSQTTKGIWLGRSSYSPVLVMDVEGTDGRERGEDTNFERKSALFSLAVSQIMIVNIWMHDIGRFQGANYPLLRTVFEQNLRLFSHQQPSSTSERKTLLLFVIRDYTTFTPLNALSDAINQDISKIWGQIDKPEGFENSNVSDFFDLDFVGLPPKPYQPEEFLSQAKKLRNRINRNNNKGEGEVEEEKNFWGEKYVTEVPVDGLCMYYDNIWNTVNSNKDLDIPTQLEMLATHRCDEFYDLCFTEFSTKIQPISEYFASPGEGEEGKEPINGFGEKVGGLMGSLAGRYDELAKRYHGEVVRKKRAGLVGKMMGVGGGLFREQIGLITEKERERMEQELEEKLKGEKEGEKKGKGGGVCENFLEVVSEVEREGVERWVKRVEESEPKGEGVGSLVSEEGEGEEGQGEGENGGRWGYEKELGVVKKVVKEMVERKREDQVVRWGKEIEGKVVKDGVGKGVGRCLDNPDNKMWLKIRQVISEGEEEVEKVGERMKIALGIGEKETNQFVDDGKEGIVTFVRNLVKSKSSMIHYHMERVFDESFNNDENGVPRKWTKADDINKIFQKCLTKSAEMMDLYAIIRLSDTTTGGEEDFGGILDENVEDRWGEENLVVTRDEAREMLRKFKKEVESDRKNAISQQEQNASKHDMPYFWMILVLIFARDELYWMITNPFAMVLCVVLVGIAVVCHQIGLTPIIRRVVMEKVQEVMVLAGRGGQQGGGEEQIERKRRKRDEKEKEKEE